MNLSPMNRDRRAARIVVATALLLSLGLGGCTIFKKKHLRCPAAAVVSGTGGVTRFVDGGDQNTNDVRYRAEISNVALTCKKARHGLKTRLTFEISAFSGPADSVGQAELPFFVVVTRGSEEVLSKRVFTSQHFFPVETGYSRYQEEISEFIPIPKGSKTSDFEILLGFQLTPDQLEYNLMH